MMGTSHWLDSRFVQFASLTGRISSSIRFNSSAPIHVQTPFHWLQFQEKTRAALKGLKTCMAFVSWRPYAISTEASRLNNKNRIRSPTHQPSTTQCSNSLSTCRTEGCRPRPSKVTSETFQTPQLQAVRCSLNCNLFYNKSNLGSSSGPLQLRGLLSFKKRGRLFKKSSEHIFAKLLRKTASCSLPATSGPSAKANDWPPQGCLEVLVKFQYVRRCTAVCLPGMDVPNQNVLTIANLLQSQCLLQLMR